MCVPSNGDGCALGLDAIEHFAKGVAKYLK